MPARRGAGPLNTETMPGRSSALPSTSDKASGSSRSAWTRICPQGVRAATHIDAEQAPRKRLLEDPLAEIAGEEQPVGMFGAQRGQKP